MDSTTRDGDQDRADDQRPDTVATQESLPFDDPVPFRLTPRGRRVVAPDDQPDLRVVTTGDSGTAAGGAGRAAGGGEPARDDEPTRGHEPTRDDQPTRGVQTTRQRTTSPRSVGARDQPASSDELDSSLRVRTRAMRRGGMHTLDIATRLDVEPLLVEQWVLDLPVPPRPRRLTVVDGAAQAVPGRSSDPDVTDGQVGGPAPQHTAGPSAASRWREARDRGWAEAESALTSTPGLRAGLGLVAGVLEPDHHALLLTSDDVELLAAAMRWIGTTLGPGSAPVRVLARHDPTTAGDRVAHEVAEALTVSPRSVTTHRDPARTGRPPAVRVRVADPELAGRVAGWRRALLRVVTDDGTGTGDGIGA